MFPDLTRDDVFRLETSRLWLRWPRLADAPGLERLAGDRAVAEMTAGIPHPYPQGSAVAFVKKRRDWNAGGKALAMVLPLREDPTSPIGTVSLSQTRGDGHPGLTAWLGRTHWGEGYATEAARAMIDAYFSYTEGPEIRASARVINPAARRVLEKCGFAYLGSGLAPSPARGGVVPSDEFRLDRRAWASLKSWSGLRYVPQRTGAQEALGA